MASRIEEALAAILTATYGEEVRQALYDALLEALTIKDNVETAQNKSQDIDVDSNSTTKYPSVKAVEDYLSTYYASAEDVAGQIENINGRMELKENKSQDIDVDSNSTTKYPSVKAVVNKLSKYFKIDETTTEAAWRADNYKIVYLNATLRNLNKKAIVITVHDAYWRQFGFCEDGNIYTRKAKSIGNEYEPNDWVNINADILSDINELQDKKVDNEEFNEFKNEVADQFDDILRYIDDLEKKTNIAGAVITLSDSTYTYDGTSKEPNVTSVTLNGQALTAGTDYAVVANPATNAGQFVVTVNGLGDYTGTATAEWTITKAQATITGDDSITISGLDESVSKTYTTNGDGAFSFAISGNIATINNSGGTVTITPTAEGAATLTVMVSEGTNYLGVTKTVSVTIEEKTVFGVMWDYSLSSPQLARLTPQNDPLGVVTDVPTQEPTACVGNDGNGQSDFDNYMPWAGMQRYNYVDGKVVDFVDYQSGETFVYIPEFWSKIVNDTTSNKMYFYISNAELSTFVKHPGSGRYMSRYECNENFLSASGFTPKVNTSLTAFRTGITAIDSKHYQYDFHIYNAIELLYIVEFAHLNTQSKIGAGITSGDTTLSVGETDILTYHTGRVGSTADDVSAVHYRWIENLWGNVWNLVDGVLIQNGLVYICNDATKYSDTITEDYISTELTVPSDNGWHKTDNCYNNCYLIPATVGSSDSTYTCDRYYYLARLRCLDVGGRHGDDSNAGLFFWSVSSAPTDTSGVVGGRSILIPGGES